MAVVAFVKHQDNMIPSHPCSIKAGDEFYLVVDGVKGPTLVAQADATPVLDEITRETIDWHIKIKGECVDDDV
ncbi:MAG: hypothetical protein WA987_11130 [Cellvibrio sp.]